MAMHVFRKRYVQLFSFPLLWGSFVSVSGAAFNERLKFCLITINRQDSSQLEVLTGLGGLAEVEDQKMAMLMVHTAIDGLCGYKETAIPTDKATGRSYRAIQLFASKSIGLGLTTEAMIEDLQQLGLSEELGRGIASCILLRASEVENSLLDASMAYGSHRLTSFDWQVGLTLASSDIANVREPYCMLELQANTSRSSEEAPQNLTIQLGVEQLQHLIQTLEQAEAALSRFEQ